MLPSRLLAGEAVQADRIVVMVVATIRELMEAIRPLLFPLHQEVRLVLLLEATVETALRTYLAGVVVMAVPVTIPVVLVEMPVQAEDQELVVVVVVLPV